MLGSESLLFLNSCKRERGIRRFTPDGAHGPLFEGGEGWGAFEMEEMRLAMAIRGSESGEGNGGGAHGGQGGGPLVLLFLRMIGVSLLFRGGQIISF